MEPGLSNNILFVCGSLNQTTQMHKIAQHLSGYHCAFTPYYADGVEDFAAKMGWLNFSVLGGRHLTDTRKYLADHHLTVDERGESRKYDLAVICSDLIIQKNIRDTRIVMVQEGITEPEGWLYQLYKALPFLPRYIANTATNGLSNGYDLFCVASEGYRELFIRKGVVADKIAVTGIPNFDHLAAHLENDFDHRDHVLVATTPYRETFRAEDRIAFLERCREIAAGRPMIFKLHPTENVDRARREIKKVCPAATIYPTGDVNAMIANASVVITQQSTCTFVALALNKETYTFLNQQELRRLMPIQNGGASAARIAAICQRVLHTPLPVLQQVRKRYRPRPIWEKA